MTRPSFHRASASGSALLLLIAAPVWSQFPTESETSPGAIHRYIIVHGDSMSGSWNSATDMSPESLRALRRKFCLV